MLLGGPADTVLPFRGHETMRHNSQLVVQVPCAGSVTPWKTHLGGEEYEPDARALADLALDIPNGTEWTEERIASWGIYYLGIPESTTNDEVVDILHPYYYGYPWEAKVGADADGCHIVHKQKHMAMGASFCRLQALLPFKTFCAAHSMALQMLCTQLCPSCMLCIAGRMAIELPYVMPDKKTVYITDDGTNTMLGMFVASEAGDLSCGSLYAAKFTQTDAANGMPTYAWCRYSLIFKKSRILLLRNFTECTVCAVFIRVSGCW